MTEVRRGCTGRTKVLDKESRQVAGCLLEVRFRLGTSGLSVVACRDADLWRKHDRQLTD